MKFSIRFADKIVGALVILALIILTVVVFMLGRSQRWFAKNYQYKTYYTSASGISVNMPVQYMGFTIGNVKKINLVTANDDGGGDQVEILFTIFDEYKDKVRYGSLVEIQISPIGLGNAFVFYSGKGEKLPEGSEIPEFSSLSEAEQIIAGRLVDRPETAGDFINNIASRANDILDKIDDAIKKINNAITGEQAEGTTNIGKIIENINTILESLNAVTGKMSDPSGTVMAVLDSDGAVYSDLVTSLNSITGILDDLDKTSDFIPSNLPGLLIDLNAALRSAQDVLTALTNNPLLRGGVPEHKEASPGGAGPRNQDFRAE